MIKKIPRKIFLKKNPDFPVASYYRNKYFFPQTYNNYILYAEGRSTIGICRNVSIGLSVLIKKLEFRELSFLGDTTSPWLFRDHDYKPVKQGLDYLIQHKISKSFNGAIQVDSIDVLEFLKHIFWLVRCNGIVFTPHFSDQDFNALISICQYGNIHFCTMNEEVDVAFNRAILDTGLHFLNESRCSSYRIPHRKATYM